MQVASNLKKLLSPKSIAIVGASERPSVGRSIQDSLKRLAFPGAVLPINPKHRQLLGLSCFPSVADLPMAPDVAAICLAAERCFDSVDELARRGAGAIVIYDGGFGETHAGKALEERIAALCREAGIALVGPNCMGTLSPWSRATTYMNEAFDVDVLKGNVGFVSQSGAVCVSFLADLRRFGVSHVISSGNEAVVETADYIDALVDDENTSVIACFSEAVRSPDRYLAALERASRAGKPVIVLKVGRSERTKRAIVSHTGGLAGETRVFSEVLSRYGAIEANDFDELVECISAFQTKRIPEGGRIAVLTGSGGQAELALDIASEQGIHLPPLSSETRKAIESVVGPLTGDGNPADIWGKGQWLENIEHTVKVLSESREVDAIGLCFDLNDGNPMGARDRHVNYGATLRRLADGVDIPLFQLNTRPGLLHGELTAGLREAGISTVCGFRQGIKAISALAGSGRARAAAPRGIQARGRPGIVGSGMLDEVKTKRALSDWGVPVVQEALAPSSADAAAIAARIGYPVVLKAVSPDLAHKTEIGAVVLNIRNERELEEAWSRIEGNLRSKLPSAAFEGCVIQPMITGGVEMFAGVSRDPEFGLTLAVGGGGILIEVLKDFAVRPLPLMQGDASRMLKELRMYPLFGGVRGAPPLDEAAFAACVEALSDFAMAHSEQLEELDVNPIKVFPAGSGCVALDGLIVLRETSNER